MGTFAQFTSALVCALALAGCASGSLSNWGFGGSRQPEAAAVQPVAPEIPATIHASEVVGRWGYAAYHRAQDRPRTEAAARSECSHPYVIGQGPTGGLMMYLADQSELQELRLKGSQNGKDYIGPAGQTPGPQDREVTSFDGRVMVLSFVDPEVAGRYGTGVYVRCAPSAGSVASAGKAKK